jgi:UDP-glucose 4-epimerase
LLDNVDFKGEKTKMAYLVTGGAGFIGSYTVRDLLKAGQEVVCLDTAGMSPIFRDMVGENNLDKVIFIQGDVSNTLFVFDLIRQYKINTVVHLATVLSATSAITSENNPAYAVQVNCVGTNNIFEAARLFGLRKVVWTGTGQVFGRIVDYYRGAIGDDNALYMPENVYTASRVFCEIMARTYTRRFGVDILGLRIAMTLGIGKIHGKGNSFTQFIKNAATDIPATMAVTDADQPRAMGYIENVSDLIVKACAAPPTKTTNFNAVEYLISCRQLVEAMGRVNPQARLTLKEKVPFEEQTWAGTPEPKLDTTGIRKELGWTPRYSLEEALTKIFNYYRQQEGLPLL